MIDTHCHLHSSEFDSNREDILSKINIQQIKAILVGTSIEDSLDAIRLASKYNYLYASIGVHPHEYENIDINKIKIEMDSLLNQYKFIAIGECGFDFYYHQSREAKEKQENLFRVHLELARQYKKPVIIHTRDSFEDTYRIISEYTDLTIILHCFTGDSNWVYKFKQLNPNIYFSFSGIITFKNSQDIQEAVKIVPENRLLVETDSPYLAPVPHRGKQNTPLFLEHNIKQIGNLRSVEYHKLINILDKNAIQVFGL